MKTAQRKSAKKARQTIHTAIGFKSRAVLRAKQQLKASSAKATSSGKRPVTKAVESPKKKPEEEPQKKPTVVEPKKKTETPKVALRSKSPLVRTSGSRLAKKPALVLKKKPETKEPAQVASDTSKKNVAVEAKKKTETPKSDVKAKSQPAEASTRSSRVATRGVVESPQRTATRSSATSTPAKPPAKTTATPAKKPATREAASTKKPESKETASARKPQTKEASSAKKQETKETAPAKKPAAIKQTPAAKKTATPAAKSTPVKKSKRSSMSAEQVPTAAVADSTASEEPAAKKAKTVIPETVKAIENAQGQSAPDSPKKLKGSLSIKFKSYNWAKNSNQAVKEGQEMAIPSDEEPMQEDEPEEEQPPIIVEQNNQKLVKCQKCLLYIPLTDYEFHEAESCEALMTPTDGREYTCSECLAVYPSQKLLVRHKRECPKRSQSMYRYKGPRDGKALEGMYSVVWKCHCKESFKSSEDLGKHRESCSHAQNYTVTCPICNSRVMGGQRVLRYHMAKNHPDLFLPDEQNSQSLLGSLQGTAQNQVITTQSADLDSLVKSLVKEHAGASVRVVNVAKDETQKPQNVATAVTPAATNASEVKAEDDEESTNAPEADQNLEAAVPQAVPKRESARQAAKAPNATVDAAKGTPSNIQDVAEEATKTPTKGKLENVAEVNEGIDEDAEIQKKQGMPSLTVDDQGNVAMNMVSQEETKEQKSIVTAPAPRVKNEDENTEENREDLEELLLKAKALTQELEAKLGRSPGTLSTPGAPPTPGDIRTPASARKTPTGRRPVSRKGQKTKTENANTSMADVKTQPRQYARVTCLDCHKTFLGHAELRRHKQTQCHGPTILDRCMADDVEVFVGEAKNQKVDITECYYCTLCTCRFSLRSQLYMHMRDEHLRPGITRYFNYHCPYCPRVFQTTRLREAHKQERHGDIDTTDEEFSVHGLDVCGKCHAYLNKGDLAAHLEVCEDPGAEEAETEAFCQLCGLVLASNQDLKLHRQKNHLSAIHFRCGQCTRTFGHALELRCHKVSHHPKPKTKPQRVEQHVMSEMKKLARKGKVKMGKSIKIHISPGHAMEEMPKQVTTINTVDARGPLIQTPTKSPVRVVTRSPTKTPMGQMTMGRTTIVRKDPKSQQIYDKIVTSGKGPLKLSQDQMAMLAKGKSIKLVLPKNTDMKKLTFNVPGTDGKDKKYLLSPKSGEGDAGEPVKDSDPQEQLAAALGLQPADPDNPGKKTVEQHRPKRLRSGRTITNNNTEAAKKVAEPKPASNADEQPQETEAQFDQQQEQQEEAMEMEEGEVTWEKAEIEEHQDDEDINNEAQEATDQQEVQMQETMEQHTVQHQEEIQETFQAEVPQTIEEMPVEEVTQHFETIIEQEVSATGDGEEYTPADTSIVVVSAEEEMAASDSAAEPEGAGLPPVQVLKPLGHDRVQCMRCMEVLESMMAVANHQCDATGRIIGKE